MIDLQLYQCACLAGGALGLFGTFVIAQHYAIIKGQENEIRAAITLRNLNQEEGFEDALDRINAPIGSISEVISGAWRE